MASPTKIKLTENDREMLQTELTASEYDDDTGLFVEYEMAPGHIEFVEVRILRSYLDRLKKGETVEIIL